MAVRLQIQSAVGQDDIWESDNCMTEDVWIYLHNEYYGNATGEIQKYNFGHSLCKYIMYWDSPIPLDQGMSDLHSAVHEKFWFTTQGAFLHQKTLIT